MQRLVRHSTVFILAAACVLGLSGCGKKPVLVKGTVVFPKDFSLGNDDLVTIIFTSQDKNVLSSSAVVSAADGTFEAKGLDGKGIIPAKYHISISVVVPPGTKGVPGRELRLKDLNKKYDPSNTPLNFEITPSTTSMTIDLSNDSVK
jgi:hypothetical protein